MQVTDFSAGIWRHYKGPLYQTLGLAHDANADTLFVANARQGLDYGEYDLDPMDERTVVVYMPLQLDGAHLGPRMAVRTLDDWFAMVPAPPGLVQKCEPYSGCRRHHDTKDSCPGHEVKTMQRFTWLGPVLTQSMLES